MLMKTVTVFTPTYNRAYLLPQLYQSLCRQTTKDFEWLVIDDGSADNTNELVNSWILENKIKIQYAYKENGGMHTGHNLAYELIKTPFNVCIDSDDYMPNDAVAIIIEQLQGLDSNFSGIIGLDADKKGNIIGTPIPESLSSCKLNDLYNKHGVRGDKKLVYRTTLMKKCPPYPEYKGEKFVPLDYKCLLLDQEYDLKPVNQVLCIVEYQLDGSSLNIFKQYRKNPRGFAFSRLSRIQYGSTFKERFKNAIHLVSSALFARDLSLLVQSRNHILVLFAIPFGIGLNFFIKLNTRK